MKIRRNILAGKYERNEFGYFKNMRFVEQDLIDKMRDAQRCNPGYKVLRVDFVEAGDDFIQNKITACIVLTRICEFPINLNNINLN